MDVMKIFGLIFTVIIIGVILKDASQFNTVMKGLNSTIGQLQQSG